MKPFDVAAHPLLAARKALGRLRRSVAVVPEEPVVRPLGNGLRFEHRKLSFLNDEDLRAMFTGSYELTLCLLLREVLREGDIMIDVGSNVGYIAAQAASAVGTSGQVHGFEPLPQCFDRMKRVQELNPKYDFRFNNVALGETEGVLPISFNPDGETRNASLVPGKSSAVSVMVPVKRLDDYIFSQVSAPERVRLIKIDVEGFEMSVLRGMERFLATTACRPAIVCEIKPWELAKLGLTLSDFDNFMTRFGYRAFDMVSGKAVDLLALADMETLLFQHRRGSVGQ